MTKKTCTLIVGGTLAASAGSLLARPDLHNNGGLVTGAVTSKGVAAPAGSQWSELQPDEPAKVFANSVFGSLAAADAINFRVADDFTITDPNGWRITNITTLAYMTAADATTVTMTGITLRIWRGQPGAPGSTIVFGDTSTNRLTGSAFDRVFRCTYEPISMTAPNLFRGVYRNQAAVSVTLPPGTYWLDWQTTGNTGTAPSSGPWVPGVTVIGKRALPGWNARQFSPDAAPGGLWSPLTDDGLPTAAPDVPIDLPFIIQGDVLPPPGCYADCNKDGKLDVLDFSCFQNKYALSDAYADCNQDGKFDVLDFTCFQNKFALGCP